MGPSSDHIQLTALTFLVGLDSYDSIYDKINNKCCVKTQQSVKNIYQSLYNLKYFAKKGPCLGPSSDHIQLTALTFLVDLDSYDSIYDEIKNKCCVKTKQRVKNIYKILCYLKYFAERGHVWAPLVIIYN